MQIQLQHALIACFLMLSGGIAHAEKLPRSLVQLSSAEVGLFKDLSDGKLDRFDLIQTSLAASGATDQATIDQYHLKYKRLSASVRKQVSSLPTKHEKAKAVHRILHSNLFKKYHVYANSLKDVFDKGDTTV